MIDQDQGVVVRAQQASGWLRGGSYAHGNLDSLVSPRGAAAAEGTPKAGRPAIDSVCGNSRCAARRARAPWRETTCACPDPWPRLRCPADGRMLKFIRAPNL